MKPVLLDTIPEPLNSWMENKGYLNETKTNELRKERTVTKIEKIYPDTKLDTKITPSAFIVKSEDEPERMTWHDAIERFDNNPESEWRLPTRDELLIMYMNKDKIGGFDVSERYWSSTEHDYYHAWVQRFGDGEQNHPYKHAHRLVRCVKKDKLISGIMKGIKNDERN